MALKAKVEAIIYAAEEPITVEQVAALLKDMVLAEESEQRANAEAAAQDAAEQNTETQEEAAPEIESVADDAHAERAAEDATSEVESADVSAEAEVAGDEGESDAEYEPAAEDGGATSEAEIADVSAEATATDDESEPLAEHEPAAEFTPVPADPKAPSGPEGDAQASVAAPDPLAGKRKKPTKKELTEDGRVIARVRVIVEELVNDYQREERGMEIRAVAGGYRMATKPEHHDVVRAFAKSLKPPVKLSLAALETLAVIAYKQPITVPEISEIRGVESGGVIGTLLDRKLITTSGRKQVVGRPILYKTSKEFLMRFGLGGLADLPSMEEFEKLAVAQEELFQSEPKPQTPVEPLQAEEVETPEQESPSQDKAAEVTPANDAVQDSANNDSENIGEAHPEEIAPETAAEEPQTAVNTSEPKPE